MEFESIFSGTCVYCNTGLVVHFTECIKTWIGGNIFAIAGLMENILLQQ